MCLRHSLDVVSALASSKERPVPRTAELGQLAWLQSTGSLPSHFNIDQVDQSCDRVSLPACCTCIRYAIPLMNVDMRTREVKRRHITTKLAKKAGLRVAEQAEPRTRVSDPRIIRRLQKWLKAGVLNDGEEMFTCELCAAFPFK
jgi:hypothetical protein